MNERVFITGVGVVSPFGVGKDLYWENLVRGQSAARMITSFDASMMPTQFWANTPETDDELTELLPNQRSGKLMPRFVKMAMIAAGEAVSQSGIDPHSVNGNRFGISVGSGGIGLVDQGLSPKIFNLHYSIRTRTRYLKTKAPTGNTFSIICTRSIRFALFQMPFLLIWRFNTRRWVLV